VTNLSKQEPAMSRLKNILRRNPIRLLLGSSSPAAVSAVVDPSALLASEQPADQPPPEPPPTDPSQGA
jgi:hypothetical protein